MKETTLEWFGKLVLLAYASSADLGKGATTFRVRTRGITIFLDTWLDKPSVLPSYLAVDEVKEADYIFISHAHFDQYAIRIIARSLDRKHFARRLLPKAFLGPIESRSTPAPQ